MTEQMLDIEVVRIDGDTQPRVEIHQQVVAEYTQVINSGTEMPPIEVVHDGANYWLVDGFHRLFAHRAAGRPQIKATVTTGMQSCAQWKSLAANKTHGVRRTNDDKRKAVSRALKMHPHLTDVAIAEHVGVSDRMVASHRQAASPTSNGSMLERRVTRSGRTIKTSGIGRKSRSKPGGIAKNAYLPVRTGAAPKPMTALNMPHDAEMGARTLIEKFSADYLRTLVAFLSNHLQGVKA